MRSKLFGDALTEGIRSVAARQGRKIGDVEQDIAEKLEYSHHTVQRWRKGHVPTEDRIEFLAGNIIRNSNLGRPWLDRFLLHAHYYDRHRLLDELCPPPRPTPTTGRQVYHNLPRRPAEFIGRQQEMKQTIQALKSRHPLVSIEGMGGIGKTSLAIEVAHACLLTGQADLAEPFEAAVFISAKDRNLELNDLFDAISYTLDLPYIAQSPPERKPREADRALREHKVLIIADNFETVADEALLTFLQQGIPEPSKAMITTRQEQLRMVWPIPLQGLAEADAIELIRRHARTVRVTEITQAEDNELRPLVKVTGGNPYAIITSLGYLKRGALTLQELVNSLFQAGESVEEIFEYIFARAWEAMEDEERCILLVMPFFVDRAPREAIGAATGLEGYYLRRGIETLIELSLLGKVKGGEEPHFSVHPLTKAFAETRLQERPKWEIGARDRWVEYYIDFAEKNGGRDWVETTGLDRLEEELKNLLVVIDWCHARERWRNVNRLFDQIEDTMFVRGYWSEAIRYSQMDIEAIEKSGVWQYREYWYLASSLILVWMGKEEKAKGEIKRVERIAQGNVRVLHEVKFQRAFLYSRSGETEEAVKLYEQCLQEVDEIWPPESRLNRRQRIDLLVYRGTLAFEQQRDLDLAKQLFEQVRVLSEESGWGRVHAIALNYLADIEREHGNLAEARELLEEGYPVIVRYKDKRRMAFYNGCFALLEEADGNKAAALDHANRALDLFSRLGMRQEEIQIEELIARVGGDNSSCAGR
jgi:LuxR family glucitol operon transcriptional activator